MTIEHGAGEFKQRGPVHMIVHELFVDTITLFQTSIKAYLPLKMPRTMTTLLSSPKYQLLLRQVRRSSRSSINIGTLTHLYLE